MQLCKKTFCRLIALLCLILVAYKLSCDSTYLYFCYLTGSTRHLTYILLAAAFVAGSALVLFSGWCRKLSRRQAILAAAAIFAAMMLVQLALILIAFRHYLPWADSLSVINEAISMASQNTPPGYLAVSPPAATLPCMGTIISSPSSCTGISVSSACWGLPPIGWRRCS